MKVVLKRNLYLGNTRYRADSNGTEVPEAVDALNSKGELVSMKVILPTEDRKVDPEKEIMLPKGTVLFDEGKAPAKIVDKPQALSQLKKPSPIKMPVAKGHEDKVDDADLE